MFTKKACIFSEKLDLQTKTRAPGGIQSGIYNDKMLKHLLFKNCNTSICEITMQATLSNVDCKSIKM